MPRASRATPPAAPLTAYLARYAERTAALARALPLPAVARVVEVLLRARDDGRLILVLGNGGSAATASHFANDLGKGGAAGFSRRFKVLALTDNVPLLTAWANDTAYEHAFAEQLRNFCGADDVVIGISGSGNSPNVLNALRLARERGAITIGLTGRPGGALPGLVDHCLAVPSDDMQHIEDMHLVALHLVYCAIRDHEVAALPLGAPPRVTPLHAAPERP
ncbi:MAG: SIS domain-containing protein [Candidatus Binatia bacterium]